MLEIAARASLTSGIVKGGIAATMTSTLVYIAAQRRCKYLWRSVRMQFGVGVRAQCAAYAQLILGMKEGARGLDLYIIRSI